MNTQIENLATRTQNIISELGGIEQLLLFYNKHKSFLSLPKAGRFTNEELTAFCKYLIGNGGIENIESNFEDNQILPDINQSIDIYESEKPFLSVRVKNVLKIIEHENHYDESIDNKALYFRKYFFHDFDFVEIPNLGLKSKSELDSLKNKILNSIANKEAIEKEKFRKEIYNSKNKNFPVDFDIKEKDELFEDGMYSFKKMVSIFLLSTEEIKRRAHLFLINSFFSEDRLDRKAISEKLNCSLERVRQIDLYLYEMAIPLAVNTVLHSFAGKPYDLIENDNRDLLYLNNFDEFIFREIKYTPNVELSKTVYSCLYKDKYELIDDILQLTSKSFEIPSSYFFVSKEFIKKVELYNLLTWLDEQIYNFEIISFEYNMDVLIKRYYVENDKMITDTSLRTLFSIMTSIKKQNFDLNEKAVKRINKKVWIDSILNEVYSFLKNKNEGQTTNVILDHLTQEKFSVEKEELLRHLNNHKSTFSAFGMGTWALTEWKKNNEEVGGSFREIVRSLLSRTDEPIHISEIYEYINLMKKVSLHSVFSNLKSETNGTFKFFNCSYIGLSEKKYSEYWHCLPKFRPVHLTHKFSEIKEFGEGKIINDLNIKYGYPKKHLKFILENQNRDDD